jgi:flagella basal body P-ring formation protein FlgA
VAAPLALALALLLPLPAPPQAPQPAEAEVRAAIVAAVRARMGDATVSIDGLRIRGRVEAGQVRAVPDAGSRVGGPMRFILTTGQPPRLVVRTGSAEAAVHVRLRHVRATRALGPGTILTPGDAATVDGDPGRVPLQRMPEAGALAGLRLRRAIADGAPIGGDAVSVPPLVRSGDEVATSVRVGAVSAQGRAVAIEDGVLGAVVRVQVDRRRLRGRVTGAGEVEITP